MPMQPLDIQKTRFAHKMRGYDPVEVENFLALVAEDLTQRLGEIERLERDNRSLRERVANSEERERQLHDAILRGTVRTYNPIVQDLIERRLPEMVKGIARAMRGDAEVEYWRLYPANINHAWGADLIREAADEVLGAGVPRAQPRGT